MSNTDSGSASNGTTIVNQSGGVSVEAETVNIGGDLIARDKIVNNVTSIYQRALTAAEEARQAHSIETEYLARGVSVYAERLRTNATKTDDRGGPYKGLLEYRLSDTEIFFGRERAIGEVLLHLDRNPLTVLHSESGAGKTSLLQAGVSARLIVNGHLPIYCRPYDVSPAQAIKQALLPNLSQTPGLSSASLRDFLWQVCNVLGANTTLYILLDQFEEFFLHLDETQRAAFVRELAECLNDAGLNARWLLALRSEFFGQLANFRPRISSPFENDYRLNRLTRDEAEAVIAKPADRYGVSFAAGLIDTLLDDLGKTDITPPQIQLVCSALYGELGDAKTITRELYEREGGAAGILRGHLERVLNRVPATQRPAARQLLEALISSEPRRIIRTRADLVAELKKLSVAPEVFDAVLDQLIQSRLIRVEGESADAGEVSYELAHDYLLDEIKLDPAVQARKAAQELLDREVQSYQRYGTLLSDDKLAILQPRRGELVVSDASRALLDKSERAFRRRRGLVFGGVGLVVTLIIVGAISVFTAIGAGQQRQAAIDQQYMAETKAADAVALRATSEASSVMAQQEQALAVSREATAVAREASANQALQKAFEQTGVVPVGKTPSALVFAANFLWVANADDNTVQAIDPATGQIKHTVSVGKQPSDLLFAAERLWVLNNGDNTVQAIDPATAQPGAPLHVGDESNRLTFDGQYIWVSSVTSGTTLLQTIDPITAKVSVSTKDENIMADLLAYDGQQLWANGRADNYGQLVALNPETGVELGTVSFGGEGDGNVGIPEAAIFDGQRLWIVTHSEAGSYSLQVIDPQQRIARQVLAGDLSSLFLRYSTVFNIAFDGQRVWLANRVDNTLQAIDPDLGLSSAPLRVGAEPVAMTYGAGHLWVANRRDNTVQAIDPVQLPSAPLKSDPNPRALLAMNDRLWISSDSALRSLRLTDGQWGPTIPLTSPTSMTQDGQRLWVVSSWSPSGTLVAINPVSNIVMTERTFDQSVNKILFAQNRLWVATNDSLTAVDPNTLAILSNTPVTPRDMIFDGKQLVDLRLGSCEVDRSGYWERAQFHFSRL